MFPHKRNFRLPLRNCPFKRKIHGLQGLIYCEHFEALHQVNHKKVPKDGIGGKEKHVVFTQVKFGRVTVNTAAEFRTANKYVPSIKPLFQETSDLLEKPNDANYSPLEKS